jgi:uncharacterized membrane protein
MRTYWITNYSSIGLTIGVGREHVITRHTYIHNRVIHFTIGFLFWTYIINIDIN